MRGRLLIEVPAAPLKALAYATHALKSAVSIATSARASQRRQLLRTADVLLHTHTATYCYTHTHTHKHTHTHTHTPALAAERRELLRATDVLRPNRLAVSSCEPQRGSRC